MQKKGIRRSPLPLLSEEYHRYEGRVVYRGDQVRNQSGEHVFFQENETATMPTAIAALNLTLWYGLRATVSCADGVLGDIAFRTLASRMETEA